MNYRLKFATEALQRDLEKVNIKIDLELSVIITKSKAYQLALDKSTDQYKTVLRRAIEVEKIKAKEAASLKLARMQPRLFS